MGYSDRTTLNNLTPNMDIGDVADPALRLAAFQYLYNLSDENYAYLQSLVTSGTLSPLPSDFMYRQAIINGNFDTWQRGTSFTLGSAGGYTADRWKFVRSGAGTTTITQDPSVPNGKSKYSLRCGGTYLVGEFEDKKYHIESLDAAKFSGQQVTISVQHKDAVDVGSNTLQILVHYASTADNFATVEAVGFSAQLPLTPEYSLASLTLTLPETSPVGGYPIGNGIQIVVRHLQSGATGSLITYLSQVQMCVGSVALSFQPKSTDNEKKDSMRYTWIPQSPSVSVRAAVYSADTITFDVPLPVQLRTTPTIRGVANSDIVVFTVANVIQSGFTFAAIVTSNGARVTATKTAHGLTDACLTFGASSGFDAEL